MLQELVNYQRSIEAAMHRGWQKEQSGLGKFCNVAGTESRPEGCDGLREGMLREDSAYEMYAGYRTAIKAVITHESLLGALLYIPQLSAGK